VVHQKRGKKPFIPNDPLFLMKSGMVGLENGTPTNTFIGIYFEGEKGPLLVKELF